ncbi:hypothetical protein GCM10010166_22030 [Couchioplanes caeruleus subsp. azureus]|nr:hypothetical protein GCM10010166_22030 [Couchioplanes caeruleus subsp. azureus]
MHAAHSRGVTLVPPSWPSGRQRRRPTHTRRPTSVSAARPPAHTGRARVRQRPHRSTHAAARRPTPAGPHASGLRIGRGKDPTILGADPAVITPPGPTTARTASPCRAPPPAGS